MKQTQDINVKLKVLETLLIILYMNEVDDADHTVLEILNLQERTKLQIRLSEHAEDAQPLLDEVDAFFIRLAGLYGSPSDD